MGLGLNAYGGNGLGQRTVAFGTTIDALVPPSPTGRQGYTRITKIVYTAAGTAHTITLLRSLGTTTVASTAAAGQAVVNLTAQPTSGNDVAANDYLAIRRAADGITRLYKVSSVSTLAITMTANLGTGAGLAAGDKVWHFGISSDTDPRTGAAHETLRGVVSATSTYSEDSSGVIASIGTDEPIMVQSNNATATGFLEQVSYSYTKE